MMQSNTLFKCAVCLGEMTFLVSFLSGPKILDCTVRGGNTLVWVLSTESLSDVTRYEVNITGADKLRILDPNNFTYVPVIEDFNWSQNDSIELKVRLNVGNERAKRMCIFVYHHLNFVYYVVSSSLTLNWDISCLQNLESVIFV